MKAPSTFAEAPSDAPSSSTWGSQQAHFSATNFISNDDERMILNIPFKHESVYVGQSALFIVSHLGL